MKLTRRVLAILCVLVLTICVGCGDSGKKISNTGNTTSDGKLKFDFERYDPYSNDKVVDLEGYEFTIASPFLKNEAGGIMTAQDTAFEAARRQTEQLLNCKITVKNIVCTVADIQPSMMAGEKVADLLHITPVNLIPAYNAGYIRAMEYIDGIDYNDERWMPNVTKLCNFDDLHLGLNFIRPAEARACLYYNRDLLKQSGVTENIVDLVRNKQWTFDKLREIMKKVTKDTDGDGKNDIYGMVFAHPQSAAAMLVPSNGTSLVKYDESGKAVENFTDPKVIEAYDYLNTLINVDKTTYVFDSLLKESTQNQSVSVVDIYNLFCRNKVAFWFTESWAGNQYIANNTVNLDYGILPLPMGPNATDYASSACHTLSFAFTTTNKDIEKSTIVFNTMARLLYESGEGEWWNEDIEKDYFNDGDTDSLEMYQLLLDKSVVDLGDLVPDLTDTLGANMVGKAIYLNQGTPTSQAEALKGTFTQAIDSLFN